MPFSFVPMEVLLYIFHHCEQTAISIPRDEQQFPWNARRVCRDWLSLIDSNPRFWQSLAFRLDRWGWYTCATRPSTMYRFGLESLALEKGKTLPLYLSFQESSIHLFGDGEKARALLSLVLDHGSRIRAVTFLGFSNIFKFPLQPGFDRLQAIEAIHIQISCLRVHDRLLTFTPLFSISPILSSITLIYPGVAYECLLRDFPLRNLTKLFLPNTVLSYQEIQGVFTQCSRLVEFSIETERSLLTPSKPAAAPTLTKLSVTMVLWREPPWELIAHTPALTSYTEICSTCDSGWGSPRFRIAPPMLSNLTDLCFIVVIQPGQMWDVLHSAPSLQNLNVWCGSPLTQRALTALAEGFICPALTSLGCLITPDEDEDIGWYAYSNEGEPQLLSPLERYPDNNNDAPFSQLSSHLDMLQMRAQNSTARKISRLRLRSLTSHARNPIREAFSIFQKLKDMIEDGWDITEVTEV